MDEKKPEAVVRDLNEGDGTMLDRLRHGVRDEVVGSFDRLYGNMKPEEGGTITGRLNNLDPEPQYVQRYGRGDRVSQFGGTLREYQRQALADLFEEYDSAYEKGKAAIRWREVDYSGVEAAVLRNVIIVDEAHYGKTIVGEALDAKECIQRAYDTMMEAGDKVHRMLTADEMRELSRRRMPEDLRPIYVRKVAPPGPGEGKHYAGRRHGHIVGKNRDKAKKARAARRKNR